MKKVTSMTACVSVILLAAGMAMGGDGENKQAPRKTDNFTKADTDTDGKISLTEFQASLPGKKNLEARFAAMDIDKDGFVSLAEFNAKNDYFSRTDTNKDGKVSRAEYAAARPGKKNADASFNANDTDKDGFISPEEYKVAAAAHKLKKEAAAAAEPEEPAAE